MSSHQQAALDALSKARELVDGVLVMLESVASPSDSVPTEVETSSVPVSGADIKTFSEIIQSIEDYVTRNPVEPLMMSYYDACQLSVYFRCMHANNRAKLRKFERLMFEDAPPPQSAVDLVGTQQTEQEAQAECSRCNGSQTIVEDGFYKGCNCHRPKQSEQVERSWTGQVIGSGLGCSQILIHKQGLVSPQVGQQVQITLIEGEQK